MTVQLLMPAGIREKRLTHGQFYDCQSFVNGTGLTKLAADAGSSVAAADAAGGKIVITTGGTNNNEAGVWTAQKTLLAASGKPMEFEALINYSEGNTNKANPFVGISSAFAADMMVDAGAGPATSFSGFGFYKVSGQTNWSVIASDGSTQTTAVLSSTNTLDKQDKTAGGADQYLRINVRPVRSGYMEVDFFIDNIPVYQMYNVTYANAAVAAAGAYLKCGSSTSEVLNLKWFQAFQVR